VEATGWELLRLRRGMGPGEPGRGPDAGRGVRRPAAGDRRLGASGDWRLGASGGRRLVRAAWNRWWSRSNPASTC